MHLEQQLHELPKKICDEIKSTSKWEFDETMNYNKTKILLCDLEEIQANYEKEIYYYV